jgi:hypothetical protein
MFSQDAPAHHVIASEAWQSLTPSTFKSENSFRERLPRHYVPRNDMRSKVNDEIKEKKHTSHDIPSDAGNARNETALCDSAPLCEKKFEVHGWWFSNSHGRLGYEDRQKASIGVTHTVDTQPVLCRHGLHASKNILDAFKYADGPVAWRVALGGTVVHGEDKLVATQRTYLQGGHPIGNALRKFIRLCALDVIMRIRALVTPEHYQHLRTYLKTGKIGMVREAKQILAHMENSLEKPGHASPTRMVILAISAWSAILPFAQLKKKIVNCLALHETLIDQPDKDIYHKNMNRRLERLVFAHWEQTR